MWQQPSFGALRDVSVESVTDACGRVLTEPLQLAPARFCTGRQVKLAGACVGSYRIDVGD